MSVDSNNINESNNINSCSSTLNELNKSNNVASKSADIGANYTDKFSTSQYSLSKNLSDCDDSKMVKKIDASDSQELNTDSEELVSKSVDNRTFTEVYDNSSNKGIEKNDYRTETTSDSVKDFTDKNVHLEELTIQANESALQKDRCQTPPLKNSEYSNAETSNKNTSIEIDHVLDRPTTEKDYESRLCDDDSIGIDNVCLNESVKDFTDKNALLEELTTSESASQKDGCQTLPLRNSECNTAETSIKSTSIEIDHLPDTIEKDYKSRLCGGDSIGIDKNALLEELTTSESVSQKDGCQTLPLKNSECNAAESSSKSTSIEIDHLPDATEKDYESRLSDGDSIGIDKNKYLNESATSKNESSDSSSVQSKYIVSNEIMHSSQKEVDCPAQRNTSGCNESEACRENIAKADDSLRNYSSCSESPRMDDNYINISLQLNIANIKSEPVEEEEQYDLGNCFNDPAEEFDCDFEENIIKQEGQTILESDSLVISNKDSKNFKFCRKSEYLDPNVYVPKAHFRVSKRKFYSKEQTTAALLMSQSSISRVIEMKMFKDLGLSYPKIILSKLEEYASNIDLISFEDVIVLKLFFRNYGRNPKKWCNYINAVCKKGRRSSKKGKECTSSNKTHAEEAGGICDQSKKKRKNKKESGKIVLAETDNEKISERQTYYQSVMMKGQSPLKNAMLDVKDFCGYTDKRNSKIISALFNKLTETAKNISASEVKKLNRNCKGVRTAEFSLKNLGRARNKIKSKEIVIDSSDESDDDSSISKLSMQKKSEVRTCDSKKGRKRLKDLKCKDTKLKGTDNSKNENYGFMSNQEEKAEIDVKSGTDNNTCKFASLSADKVQCNKVFDDIQQKKFILDITSKQKNDNDFSDFSGIPNDDVDDNLSMFSNSSWNEISADVSNQIDKIQDLLESPMKVPFKETTKEESILNISALADKSEENLDNATKIEEKSIDSLSKKKYFEEKDQNKIDPKNLKSAEPMKLKKDVKPDKIEQDNVVHSEIIHVASKKSFEITTEVKKFETDNHSIALHVKDDSSSNCSMELPVDCKPELKDSGRNSSHRMSILKKVSWQKDLKKLSKRLRKLEKTLCKQCSVYVIDIAENKRYRKKIKKEKEYLYKIKKESKVQARFHSSQGEELQSSICKNEKIQSNKDVSDIKILESAPKKPAINLFEIQMKRSMDKSNIKKETISKRHGNYKDRSKINENRSQVKSSIGKTVASKKIEKSSQEASSIDEFDAESKSKEKELKESSLIDEFDRSVVESKSKENSLKETSLVDIPATKSKSSVKRKQETSSNEKISREKRNVTTKDKERSVHVKGASFKIPKKTPGNNRLSNKNNVEPTSLLQRKENVQLPSYYTESNYKRKNQQNWSYDNKRQKVNERDIENRIHRPNLGEYVDESRKRKFADGGPPTLPFPKHSPLNACSGSNLHIGNDQINSPVTPATSKISFRDYVSTHKNDLDAKKMEVNVSSNSKCNLQVKPLEVDDLKAILSAAAFVPVSSTVIDNVTKLNMPIPETLSNKVSNVSLPKSSPDSTKLSLPPIGKIGSASLHDDSESLPDTGNDVTERYDDSDDELLPKARSYSPKDPFPATQKKVDKVIDEKRPRETIDSVSYNEKFKNLNRAEQMKIFEKYKYMYNVAKIKFHAESDDLNSENKFKRLKEMNHRKKQYYNLKRCLHEIKKQNHLLKNKDKTIQSIVQDYDDSKLISGSSKNVPDNGPYSPSTSPILASHPTTVEKVGSRIAKEETKIEKVSSPFAKEESKKVEDDCDQPYSPTWSPDDKTEKVEEISEQVIDITPDKTLSLNERLSKINFRVSGDTDDKTEEEITQPLIDITAEKKMSLDERLSKISFTVSGDTDDKTKNPLSNFFADIQNTSMSQSNDNISICSQSAASSSDEESDNENSIEEVTMIDDEAVVELGQIDDVQIVGNYTVNATPLNPMNFIPPVYNPYMDVPPQLFPLVGKPGVLGVIPILDEDDNDDAESLATALALPPPPPPPPSPPDISDDLNWTSLSSQKILLEETMDSGNQPKGRISNMIDDFFKTWEKAECQVLYSSVQQPKPAVNMDTLYQEQPLIQQKLNHEQKQGFPLVGLQFILEVQKERSSKLEACNYICTLCSKKMSAVTLFAHVKSVPHRLKYSECYAKDIFEKYGKIQIKQWTAALVKEFTLTLNATERSPRGSQMAVATEKTMNDSVKLLKKKVEAVIAGDEESQNEEIIK